MNVSIKNYRFAAEDDDFSADFSFYFANQEIFVAEVDEIYDLERASVKTSPALAESLKERVKNDEFLKRRWFEEQDEPPEGIYSILSRLR